MIWPETKFLESLPAQYPKHEWGYMTQEHTDALRDGKLLVREITLEASMLSPHRYMWSEYAQLVWHVSERRWELVVRLLTAPQRIGAMHRRRSTWIADPQELDTSGSVSPPHAHQPPTIANSSGS